MRRVSADEPAELVGLCRTRRVLRMEHDLFSPAADLVVEVAFAFTDKSAVVVPCRSDMYAFGHTRCRLPRAACL